MRKAFESINQYIDADSAYLALRPEARGPCNGISEVEVDSVTNIDERVRELVDDLYDRGYQPETERLLAEVLDDLGIPADGRASERAANAVTAYVA